MSQVVKEPEAKAAAPESESATPQVTSAQSATSAPVQPVQQPVAPQASQAGQAPFYGVPVYGVPVAAPNRSNGLSIAALVCGIVGLVFAFIPFFGAPVGIVLGVLATVMGAIGMRKAASKGMGITGLVLGILALMVSLGWFFLTFINW